MAIAQGEERWGKSPAVVHEIACAFYDMMVDSKFLPNSPTLMNAGKGNQLQYSACYVLPVGDSMEEIFDAVKSAAIIHKSGGGTGFAFSRLRQKDAVVTSTGGKASGPVSFLRVFNGATEAVKQGGTRRGANMGILRIDHPDILEFIECKLDGGIVNFNISVAATDRFMDAIQKGEEYELIAPHNGEVVGRLPARDVFDRIVRAAWQTGDPGMVFLDRINASPANPTPEIGLIEATNPCGEQPLLPNEACNLGSINVAMFARRQADGEWAVDWTELERVVRLSVRFLDDVIEVNPYPLPEIDETVKSNRRIGLGVMGWADLLFRMGIPYDSQPALDLGDRLMAFINEKAHDQSAKLAEERGPFPNWPRSIYKHGRPAPELDGHDHRPHGDDLDDRRLLVRGRAGLRGGLHPQGGRPRPALHEPDLRRGGPGARLLLRRAHGRGRQARRRPRAAGRAGGRPAGLRHGARGAVRVARAAPGRVPEVHGQRRLQDHQPAQLGDGRRRLPRVPPGLGAGMPRHHGLPGRLQGGCPHVGTKAGKADKRGEAAVAPPPAVVKPRPRSLTGRTYRVETPLGTAYIVVNEHGDGEPFEVFVSVGKAGSDTMAVAEAMGRLISLALRMPSPLSTKRRLEEIVAQLTGIGGGRPLGFGPQRVLSLPDGIARVLAEHLGQTRVEEAEPPAAPAAKLVAGDICPECGQATFVYEEGCKKCYGCGFNEC